MAIFPQPQPIDFAELWLPQGNLFKKNALGKWIKVSATGEAEVSVDRPLPRESLGKVLDIAQERRVGERILQRSLATKLANFVPLSSLEMGARQSRAICRIARYFSRETFGELLDVMEDLPQASDFSKKELLQEILTIPEAIAQEIFQPGEPPLTSLRNLSDAQLAKINPIPVGTGFLVGGTHLMTNHHVISDADEASECVAQFNYVRDAAGRLQPTVDYEFDSRVLFVTNPDLDYTLVQLKAGKFTRQAGYVFGWLQLSGDDSRLAPGLSKQAIAALAATADQAEAEARLAVGDLETIVEQLDGHQGRTLSPLDEQFRIILDRSTHLMARLERLRQHETDVARSFPSFSYTTTAAIDSYHQLAQELSKPTRSKLGLNLPPEAIALSLKFASDLRQNLDRELSQLQDIRAYLQKKLVALASEKEDIIASDRVILIQHPKGQEKQLVQNDNGLLSYEQDGMLKNFVRYSAVSDYGSSGSPVFNTRWELVALHHAVIVNAPGKEAVEIGACQGVRICRIVEDLQAKGATLPKVKSFLQDFVVTTEQLTYPPLPAAISLSRGSDVSRLGGTAFVTTDIAVAWLTASTDGTLKLWNQAGIEIQTLQLGGRGEIDRLALSADGRSVAVVRSPQDGQRSSIELWDIDPWTANAPEPTRGRCPLQGDHPLWTMEPWNAKPTVGDLSFSADGSAIAAITVDGYVDVWAIDDGKLLLSRDIFKADREADLRWLEANQQQTSLPEHELDELLDPDIKQQASSQAAKPSHTYSETPLVRYDARSKTLVYGKSTSATPDQPLPELVIKAAGGAPQTPEVGANQVRFSPDGQQLYVLESLPNPDNPENVPANLSLWQLDSNTRDWARVETLPPPLTYLVAAEPAGDVKIQDVLYTAQGKRFAYVSDRAIYLGIVEEEAQLLQTIPLDYFGLGDRNPLRQTVLSSDGQGLLLIASDGTTRLVETLYWQSVVPKSLAHPGMVAALAAPARDPLASPALPYATGSTYTLEVWVKPRTADAGPLVQKSSPQGLDFYLMIRDGKVRFLTSRQDYTYDLPGEPNTLLHLAIAVRDPTEIILYINGTEVEGQPTPKPGMEDGVSYEPAPGPGADELDRTPLLLGAGSGGAFDGSYGIVGFDGEMIEVRLWNTLRTAEELRTHAQRRLPLTARAEGLVGYWRFEEIQGQRIPNLARDGDFAIVDGAEILTQVDFPLPIPSGVEFEALESRVKCDPAEAIATPTALTLEAWVRHLYGDGTIASRLEDEGPGYALRWQNNRIRVILQGQTAAARTVVETQQALPGDRAFHHIAFTWDASSQEIEIYIDGRRQDTVSIEGDYKAMAIDGQYRSTGLFKGSLAATTAPLIIGATLAGQGLRRWTLAEVRLWAIARTQNQIQSAMARRLSPADLGLVGYWRLDDDGDLSRNWAADWQNLSADGGHGTLEAVTYFLG